MKKFGLMLLIAVFTMSSFAYAQQRGKRDGPPQAALDACQNQTKGTACTFEHRKRGNVEGVCINKRRGDGLICKANPPQKVIDACNGLAENDSCSFEGRRGEVTGKCTYPPETETLACKPDRKGKKGKRGGQGGKGRGDNRR